MSITTLTPVAPSAGSGTLTGDAAGPARAGLAPVIALASRRRPLEHTGPSGPSGPSGHPGEPSDESLSHLGEVGAASAEYAAVTACGVGLAGVLLKLLSSDFGQNLLKTLIEFFLKMVGIG